MDDAELTGQEKRLYKKSPTMARRYATCEYKGIGNTMLNVFLSLGTGSAAGSVIGVTLPGFQGMGHYTLTLIGPGATGQQGK